MRFFAAPRLKIFSRPLVWAVLLLGLASALPAQALVATSIASGNWNAASTWLGGIIPGANDDVIIAIGNTITVNASASCRSLTLTGGVTAARVTISGSNSLTVSRDATVYAPLLNATNWISVGSGTLNVGRDLILSGGLLGTRRAQLSIGIGTVTVGGNVSVNNTRALVTFTGSGTLNIGGDFSSGGSFTRSTGTVAFNGNGAQRIGTYTYNHLTISKPNGNATLAGNIGITGNLSDNGRLNAITGSRTVTFNGTAAQNLTGAAANTTFYRLTLNNSAGLTVNHNITIDNNNNARLTLSRGVLSTGANRAILQSRGSVSRTASSTSNFVFGNLQKYVATGNNRTVNFEVGSGTSYALATLRINRVTTTGSITVSTTSGEHPQIATSGIDQTRDVNRYWTITNSGVAFNSSGYAATFNFQASDRDAGSNPNAYVVRRYTLGTWNAHTMGTRTATSTQATGILTFGDFAVGEIAPLVDHFAISHGSTGVNCQAEPVTITAHTAAHALATLSSSVTITISTSTGHGDWSLQTGTGTLVNGGNGNATYTFGNESSIVLLLKDTFPETTNINVAWGAVTERSGTAAADAPFDPNLTFTNSGFRFIDGSGAETIATQTAGVTSAAYYLQAIRTDTRTGACVGVFGAGQTAGIDLAFQCNNPTTCAGRQVAFTNNGTTNLAANPGTGVTIYSNNIQVRFLNDGTSRAAFTLNYPDAGAISLHARYNIPLGSGGASPNYTTGSSNVFVVKPDHFVLSGIQQTAAPNLPNPAATNANGAKFVKAGEAFSVTVTAVNSSGAATPNYGREVSPEGVKLTSTLVSGLGLVNNPPLNNSSAFGAFSNGAATGTSFSWDEVGIISLIPSVADGDYLGAGDVTGTAVGNVGRFIPDHFVLSSSNITNRTDLYCAGSTFTYMAEPFTLDAVLAAQNSANATTQNYATGNGFAKLDGTTASKWMAYGSNDSLGVWGIDNAATPTVFPLAGGRFAMWGSADVGTCLAAPSGNWLNGVGKLSGCMVFQRAASVDGPYTALDVGIAPQDADGVRSAAFDLDVDRTGGNDHIKLGRINARFGRLRMNNAYGSELLPLPVPLLAQYWNGTGFILNTDDSCTQVPVPTSANGGLIFAAQTPTNQLANPETTASLNTPFINGDGGLHLSTPGLNNYGYVDVLITAPAYLQFNWNGIATAGNFFDDNPGARATFGKYKQRNEIIYMREIH